MFKATSRAIRVLWDDRIGVVLFVYGFLLAALYWPDIAGPATSPRWAFLALTLPACLVIDRIKITVAHAFGAAFVVWVLARVYWDKMPLDAVGDGWKLLIVATAFCIGGFCTRLRPLLLGSAFGIGLSVVVCLLQFTHIHTLTNIVNPRLAGLFVNPILLGEACALVAVGLFAERIYWAIPIPLAGLLLSDARAPVLALGIGCAATLIRSPRVAALVVSLALIAAILAQGFAFGTMGIRFELWHGAASGFTLLGQGLGSYWQLAVHPAHFVSEHAHNEFIELTFEAGLIGGALFVAFCIAVLMSGASTEQAIFVALLVEACFAFPLHEPFTAAVGLMSAGCACRRLRGLGSTFADCGSRLRGWLVTFQPGPSHRLSERSGRHVSVRSSLPRRPVTSAR